MIASYHPSPIYPYKINRISEDRPIMKPPLCGYVGDHSSLVIFDCGWVDGVLILLL